MPRIGIRPLVVQLIAIRKDWEGPVHTLLLNQQLSTGVNPQADPCIKDLPLYGQELLITSTSTPTKRLL